MSDADRVEVFNIDRIEKGLKQFDEGKYSKQLLNLTVLAISVFYEEIIKRLHFDTTRNIYQEHLMSLREYLEKNRGRIKTLIYKPIYYYAYRRLGS